MFIKVTSIATVAAMLLPLALAPAPVLADEQCRALCRNMTPMSLTASSDSSDDCDRLSREAGYPCDSPRYYNRSTKHSADPRGPRHRIDRRVPDAGYFGLY